MNTELLTKVKDWIHEHMFEVDMSQWDCGTTACIGGIACRLAGEPITDLIIKHDVHVAHCCRLLGLGGEEGKQLLYLHLWPEQIKNRYRFEESCGNQRRMAQVVIERIDQFMNEDKLKIINQS
jgi:hypothetical protein